MTTTYLLVHGAWHGAWCWDKVRAIFEANGNEVIARSLPGMAELKDECFPEIGLESHISAATGWAADLTDGPLILVGHSYGGMVITGVADRLPGRISQLVYLDAYCPRSGESIADILGAGPRWQERAEREGEGWLLPPPAEDNFGLTDPQEVRELRRQLTPQPLRTFMDPIHLEHDPGKWRNVTWIVCEPHGPAPFPHWRYVTMNTGHDAMLTEPEALCRILEEIGARNMEETTFRAVQP